MNPNPIQQFESPWPMRLKALKKGEVLLIGKDELPYRKVKALVANMNYRNRGDFLFSYEGAADTDTIITCMFRSRDAVTGDGRLAANKRKKRSDAGSKRPKTVPTVADLPAEVYQPAIALIEATYINGNVKTYRAHDKADYDGIMESTAGDMTIVQVQTFVLTHTKKREYSWKDETAPTKG